MSSYVFKEPSMRYRILILSLLFSIILITILGGYFLAPIMGYVPFFVLVFLLLFLLVFIHSKNTVYMCTNCDHEFEISFWQDLITMHMPGKKFLKCPKCSYKDYAIELVKTKNNLKE